MSSYPWHSSRSSSCRSSSFRRAPGVVCASPPGVGRSPPSPSCSRWPASTSRRRARRREAVSSRGSTSRRASAAPPQIARASSSAGWCRLSPWVTSSARSPSPARRTSRPIRPGADVPSRISFRPRTRSSTSSTRRRAISPSSSRAPPASAPLGSRPRSSSSATGTRPLAVFSPKRRSWSPGSRSSRSYRLPRPFHPPSSVGSSRPRSRPRGASCRSRRCWRTGRRPRSQVRSRSA